MTNTIQTPNPASGDGLESTPDGLESGQKGPSSNDVDPIMQDIDALFGGSDSSATSGDGLRVSGKQDADDPSGIAPSQGQAKRQTKDSFDGMTPEQRATHFQSLYNKLENEYNGIKPAYDKYKNVADFVNQVYEDPQVKEAFLAELAPDLVKPKDPYVTLQERLGKEFGEDYVPDEDEAAKPLSKSWRYYKRVDELYKELSDKKPSIPKSIEELRKERESELTRLQGEYEKERDQIVNDLKWSNNDWDSFEKWRKSLKLKHAARYFQGLRKLKQGSAPNLVNQFGGAPLQSTPEVFQELEQFYG